MTEQEFLDNIYALDSYDYVSGCGWRKTLWNKAYRHYFNHKLHRENGPAAYMFADRVFSNYCLDGYHYTKEEWFKCLTPEQQVKALFNEENW